jgi:hypothetical protein
VRKTDNSWFFSKFNGHNFVKNLWIRIKLKLDLYLGMAKQCTKYQMNMRKKVCKTDNSWFFFLSPRAITSRKINGSEPNSNLVCILVWQSNVPNIKWISVCRERKKVRKTLKSLMGHNSSKNWSIATIFELDLQVIHIKPCTKFQCNSCAHSGKKSGKLCGRTDKQTDGYKTYSPLRLHR